MKRKMLAAVLTAAMVMSMAGCGAGNSGESKTETKARETEAAQSAKEDVTEAVSAAGGDAQKADGDKIVIGMTVGNLANEANVTYAEAAEAYAKTLDNVELLVLDGEASAENQVAQCESFIAQGVDCVIMQAYDAAGCMAGVEACNEAGIPVFASKTTVEDMDKVAAYVGSDDFTAGQIEMNHIAEKLGGKGNIVILEGPAGISAAILRNDGIQDVLTNYPDINTLYTQPANWNRDEGMQLMENWLQMGADIDAVVAHNDEMALGAYDAIVAAGKQEEIPVIGIDAISAAVESVKAGELCATVLQDGAAIGEKSVDVAVMLAKGEEVEKTYDIPYVLLTKDNITEYFPD